MEEYFNEWESLITELSQKELAYIEWKEFYRIKEEEIINTVNFKELYGANNEKVRRNHVKNALKQYDQNIVDLELSIDWIKRRISFLKGITRYKTAIIPTTNEKYGEWNVKTNTSK